MGQVGKHVLLIAMKDRKLKLKAKSNSKTASPMFEVSILGSATTWSKLIFDSSVQYTTLQFGPKVRLRYGLPYLNLDSGQFFEKKKKIQCAFYISL